MERGAYLPNSESNFVISSIINSFDEIHVKLIKKSDDEYLYICPLSGKLHRVRRLENDEMKITNNDDYRFLKKPLNLDILTDEESENIINSIKWAKNKMNVGIRHKCWKNTSAGRTARVSHIIALPYDSELNNYYCYCPNCGKHVILENADDSRKLFNCGCKSWNNGVYTISLSKIGMKKFIECLDN